MSTILDEFDDGERWPLGKPGLRSAVVPRSSRPETRDARRVLELLGLVEEERCKRIAVEHQAAGLRSTITRLNAKIARLEAQIAEQRAGLSTL